MHMAGASAFRSFLGFGRTERLHSSDMHLSFDLSIVIEMVDTEAKIEAFLTECRTLLESALVTKERVRALNYRERPRKKRKL
jgi:uncharacterized protein